MDYINKNNLLNEKQFGFRPNHSTYMAVIELVDKIANAVERNEPTLGIFLDLSKAFDTINHDILLYKLEYYGFRGVALDWFKSYFINRKQFVRYQMHDSYHKIINCGVPQGPILGPLLFTLYINDIVNTTSLLELILFADDTTLLFSHPDIASQNEIINNELQEICNWFQANKLSVNASKTNYMVLGTHHSTRKFIDINQDIDILNDSESTNSRDVEKRELNIKLHGVSLNRVSSTKFLGVIIDENLTWKNHIDAISKTISRYVGMLTKLKHFVSENILYSLNCTLILPYINYGVLIWGNTCKIRYLNSITGLSERYQIASTEATPDLCSQNVMFLMYMIYSSSILVYLCINITQTSFHQFLQSILLNMFKHTVTQQEMPRVIVSIKQKKMFSDCAIRNCGPSFWNSLDKTIKHCKTTKHFRNQLKSVLLSEYN